VNAAALLLAAHPGWVYPLVLAPAALVAAAATRLPRPRASAAVIGAVTAAILIEALWWHTRALAPLVAEASPALRATAALISHAGDPPLLWALAVGVGGLLWLQHERRLALVWAAALAGNGLTVRALKALLESARPADAEAFSTVSGFSFPSGHAAGALLAWGLLGAIAWRLAPTPARGRAVCIGCALIAAAVGTSRWVQGAHHLSDVVAGWLCGGAWLLVALAAWPEPRAATRPPAAARPLAH
jgi:membrane-associated phospholipid phosphatase